MSKLIYRIAKYMKYEKTKVKVILLVSRLVPVLNFFFKLTI